MCGGGVKTTNHKNTKTRTPVLETVSEETDSRTETPCHSHPLSGAQSRKEQPPVTQNSQEDHQRFNYSGTEGPQKVQNRGRKKLLPKNQDPKMLIQEKNRFWGPETVWARFEGPKKSNNRHERGPYKRSQIETRQVGAYGAQEAF